MNLTRKTLPLAPLSLVCVSLLQGLPSLQAQQWTIIGNAPTLPNTVVFSNYDWNDPANWTTATIPNAIGASALLDINILNNGPGGPQLQGTQQINLNVPTTLGNLTMGDLNTAAGGFNGNGFYNIANGTAGSLTFEASAGNASLQKTTASGTTDSIAATITLNSTLAADIRTGTIRIDGAIGGTGGILRSGSVGAAVSASLPNGGAILQLTNNNNSYTGTTSVQHGTLSAVLNGDVLASTNSVLGNSASAIVIGTPGFSTTTASHNAQILRFNAGSDSANYTIDRGLDFSGVTQASAGSAQLLFDGNAAGGANTNRLTLTGPITFGGSRSPTINSVRTGQTIDITGLISGTSTGSVSWGGFPSGVNADGQPGGTVRLSNAGNSYTANNFLNIGTMIIAGSVGALGTNSPIGQGTLGLSNGTGGNITGTANFGVTAAANDTSPASIRSVYLETPGTSFARILNPGGGSSAVPGGGAYVSAVSVINGFRIGGLNTTGTTSFTGAINPNDVNVGASPTNAITTAVNMALIAQTGGTVEFTGGIADTTSAATHARVTINQFRNNPHIDGMNAAGTSGVSDGIVDPTANQLVGTATSGTVVISGGAGSWNGTTEVLGGTLRVNSSVAGNILTVASGATLGGSGLIDTGIAASVLQVNGTLAPGNSPGLLTSNKPISLNAGSIFSAEINGPTAGTQYDQLAANSTLTLNSTAVFSLTLGYAPTPGEQFTLINLASGVISGTFLGLPEGSTKTASFGGTPYDFTASYAGGTGNDFVLTAVPEPAVTGFLAGATGLLLRRRRKGQ